MGEFEHYGRKLVDLDHEIRQYAAVCGIELANRGEIGVRLRIHHDPGPPARPETLHGLLILHIKLEAEMVELGFSPSPLVAQPSNN